MLLATSGCVAIRLSAKRAKYWSRSRPFTVRLPVPAASRTRAMEVFLRPVPMKSAIGLPLPP